ncbi:MAG TPA: hypothetical protein VFZ00_32385 [Solirubrobacter sp.]|nr:hypothetical protein [Solirubrobacter sp.]
MATTATAPERAARTVQRVFVCATPAETYRAIWEADLLRSRLARALSAIALWPDRIHALLRREPPPPKTTRSARLADMLGEGSPWILLADEPDREVVLGLLWTPPAGGTTCAPEDFERFAAPGVAKVVWSIAVAPYGAGHSLLTTETRTEPTDAVAGRRLRLIWPLIRPFASLLRMQVLRAIKAHAERG